MHMAKTSIPFKEKNNLKMMFDAIDEEKDGEIELKELVIQLKQKFDINTNVSQMEGVINQIDLDFDGKIQFTEFLIACCNKKQLFTAHNIEQCFNYIDANQDGEIDTEDMSTFLGTEINQ